MGNFLDFFKGPGALDKAAQKNSVSVYSVGPLAKSTGYQKPPPGDGNVPLPRAVAVYGAAAAGFGVLAVYYLFSKMWFTGLILLIPTFCLAGFAWYYLKVSSLRP